MANFEGVSVTSYSYSGLISCSSVAGMGTGTEQFIKGIVPNQRLRWWKEVS
jgi:hypothetical protein